MKERLLIFLGLVGYTAFLVIIIAIFFGNIANANTAPKFHYGQEVKLKSTMNLSREALFYNCDKVVVFEITKYVSEGDRYEIKPSLDHIANDKVRKSVLSCWNRAEIIIDAMDLEVFN